MYRSLSFLGFPKYSVSSQGQVKGPRKILKPIPDKDGYFMVTLYGVRGSGNYYIHRLVAQAFIVNPEELTQVNHEDGNKQNNEASNLQWMTPIQNGTHAAALGLYKKGEQCSAATLDEEAVRYARKIFASGDTIASIAGQLSVSETAISNIVKGKTWKHI